jgi:hypothetical protein
MGAMRYYTLLLLSTLILDAQDAPAPDRSNPSELPKVVRIP